MLSTVERTLRERRLFDKGARVLVAVSGGPDSMALLHALWELRGRWSLHLEIATVDHGLRPAAAKEAAFVMDHGAALELPCHLLALGLGASPRPRGVSLMTFARDRRREALQACARRQKAEVVALGHHADDQIETVLFRLVRGTGLRGLGGMPIKHEGFVRPLLGVRRAAVLHYLASRSIPFLEDPSNADPRFTRSRMRHQLLPLLAQENPRFGEALLSLAEEAASETHPRRRAWREVLGEGGLHASRGAWAAMLQAADEGGSRSFDLHGGRAEVRYGELVTGGRSDDGPPSEPPREPEDDVAQAVSAQTIVGAVDVPFGSYLLRISEADAPGVVNDPSLNEGRQVVSFDADAVPFPWTVRAWRPGDRMRPRAGLGSRKLSDLFIDARIPRARRAHLPLVLGPDETILFVPGLRPSERGRPTSESRRLILLETRRKDSVESSR
jgi:tRNA(Ile)-lysidine synthase